MTSTHTKILESIIHTWFLFIRKIEIYKQPRCCQRFPFNQHLKLYRMAIRGFTGWSSVITMFVDRCTAKGIAHMWVTQLCRNASILCLNAQSAKCKCCHDSKQTGHHSAGTNLINQSLTAGCLRLWYIQARDTLMGVEVDIPAFCFLPKTKPANRLDTAKS